MEYINLDAQVGNLSGVLSPARYLEHLPSLADDLPAGARRFATAPEHYDFSSKRCVKDLEVQHIRGVGADDQQMEIQFRHNCWKHVEDLVIRYTGVSSFDGVSIEDNDWVTVGTAILDEVCPTSTAAVTRSRSGTAHSPSSAVISSRYGPRLTAPTIHIRSKADQDPAEWLPPSPEALCRYGAEWGATKLWGLAVDEAERDRLWDIAAGCGGTDVEFTPAP